MSDHAYATTWPGAESLGDQKQLQSDEIELARSKQQNSNPATVGPPELAGKLGKTIAPGQRIFATELQGQGGLRRVYDINPMIQEQRADIAIVADRIERAYHTDVFLAITRIDGGNMRVVEVDARIREQMSQLGPIVEGLSEQQNDPAILRTFRIAERAGIVPEPPQVLQGVPIKIDYISILAQAQKAADIDKLDRFFVAATNVAQVDPAAAHRFHGDSWMKEYADQLGVPPSIVRGDKETQALVERDAQQAQAQAMQQQALDGARAAKDASQADLSGDTALTAAVDAARGA